MDHLIDDSEAVVGLQETIGIVIACRQHGARYPSRDAAIPNRVIDVVILDAGKIEIPRRQRRLANRRTPDRGINYHRRLTGREDGISGI